MIVKKPKLWNVLIATGVLLIVLTVLTIIQDLIPPVVFCCVFVSYLILVLIFLLNAFVRQLQYNLYSYNTIFYAGFAFLVLFLLISNIVFAVRAAGLPTEYDIFRFIINLSNATAQHILYSTAVVFLFSVLLIISNILLIVREGKKPLYFGCIAIALALIALIWFLFRVFYPSEDALEISTAGSILMNLLVVLYLYFECMVSGAIIAVILAARKRPQKDRDFILVLGCGLNEDGTPAPVLARRIDEALKFYQEQIEETGKNPILIPSGGKGSETRPSESEAMTRYLLERKVPREHIMKEDQSKTTNENMLFSRKIIEEKNPLAKVSYVTSDYHVFRSGVTAGHAGLKAIGIGARTRWYFLPNAILREFLGLISGHVLKQLFVLLGTALVYMLPAILLLLMV